jgi:cyclopropane-fatty-acyl-phospholipid synthase
MKTLTIEHTRFAYFADFWIYLLAVLLLPAALAGLSGLVAWSLIEYAMHRFVFHGMEPFQSLHAQHHLKPMALISTPTVLSLSLISALAWLPTVLLFGFWLGSGVALGVTTGYFVYGVIHHGAHHWRARGAWMQQCKRRHAIHHHNPRVNYGVTMLWWDQAFGSRAECSMR